MFMYAVDTVIKNIAIGVGDTRYLVKGHGFAKPECYELAPVIDRTSHMEVQPNTIYLAKPYVESNYKVDPDYVLLPMTGSIVPTKGGTSGAYIPIPIPTSNRTQTETKFKIGDLLREVDNNSIYRYVVKGIDKYASWGPYGTGYAQYVLERQATDYLPAQLHTLSQEFCESNFTAVMSDTPSNECRHEWAVYNSGFRSFEYCRKCNKDRQ